MKFSIKLLQATFRGLGQIMLQNNAVTGVLFAVGVACCSMSMAISAVAGSMTGTLLAQVLHFPKIELEDGLYGFNAALVAIAGFVFLSPSYIALSIAIFCLVLATVLMRVMSRYNLMPFTFPFVASTWLLIEIGTSIGMRSRSEALQKFSFFDSIPQAFGEVMFQTSSITGVIFIFAILVNSRTAALFGIVGAALALCVGILFHWPQQEVFGGLIGFNAVLAAIALHVLNFRLMIILFGCILSIFLTKLFLLYGIISLTAPFVFSTWATLALMRFFGPAFNSAGSAT